MFYSFIAIAVLFAQNLAAAVSPDPYEEARTLTRLEIWKAISSGLASSATVAFMDDGKIVYSETFGMRDREKSLPPDKHTQFNIGSISKLFISSSILLMREDEKVELDRPVTEYLPEFVMRDGRYKNITVRMLLNHTSGFAGTYGKDALGNSKNVAYARDTINAMADEYLKHDPGILSIYCNDGFSFAQMILERVTGLSYPKYLDQRIFTKLGMNDSSCNFMVGNDNVVRAYDNTTGLPVPLEYVNAIASGGISSTAEDLCRFSTVLYTNALFTTATLEEFQKPQYGPQTVPEGLPYYRYGLGWDNVAVGKFHKQGVTVLAKNGVTSEFTGQLHVAPHERLTVAVIVSGKADVEALTDNVMQALLEGKGVVPKIPVPITPTPKKIAIPDELLTFEGYYGAGDGVFNIVFDRIGNTVRILKYENGVFALHAEYPYVEGGYFHVNEKKTMTFSENFGEKFMLYHFPASDGVSIVMESLPALASGIDGSAFDNKTWLPRNVDRVEFGYRFMKTSLMAELPGYVYMANAPYALIDARTTVMNLRHGYDLMPPRLFERDGKLWLYASGFEYSDASLTRNLQPGETITIGPKGFNEWRKAGSEMIFSSTLPEATRILAWSAEKDTFYDSLSDGAKDIFLPEGSYVGFIGPPGAVFTVAGDPAGNTYEINFLSSTNGTITGTTPQTILHGESSAPVTAEPAENCKFANWTGNGWFVTTTENPLTLPDVTADRTITANFAKIIDISEISAGGRKTIPDLADTKDGMKNIFVFNITDEKDFKLITSGGTGDCDIYLKHGAAPDLNDYSRKSTLKGTAEVLEVKNPQAGDWYVFLYPAADFANVKLNIDINNEVPAKPLLSASISGTKVNLEWNATGVSYDVYRSVAESLASATVICAGTESLTYQEDFVGTYFYYWVKAKVSKYIESDFSNAAAPHGSDIIIKTLKSGVHVINISGAESTTKTYQIDVPEGQALLEIKTYGGKGDYELCAGIDGSSNKYHALIDSVSETIRIENPEAGSYLIHLYGKTDYSGVAIVAKYYQEPPAPGRGLIVGKGGLSDRIILSWADSPGATFYEIWRAGENSFAVAAQIGEVPDNSYEDNAELEYNVKYYYWIKAGNSKGVSRESAGVSGFLMKKPSSGPARLRTSKSLHFDRISLSWPRHAGASAYLIYRNTVNNPDAAITMAEVASESNLSAYSYDDMGDSLTTGTKYYYFIKAKNGSGTSDFSRAAIGMLKNSGPASISASHGIYSDKVMVSWSAVPGATGYDVYRYTDKDLTHNDGIFEAGGKLTYDDATAIKGTTYYYRVKAKYKERYSSLFSPSASGYFNDIVKVLRAPAIKSVSKGDYGYVRIIWSAVRLAENYKIYRNTLNQFDTSNLIATSANTVYSDLTAFPDTDYWYWIKANNDTADATSVPSMPKSGFAKSASIAIADGGIEYADSGKGSFKFYSVEIPEGATRLVVTATGTSLMNNCDLYVKLDSYPSLRSYNARGADALGGKTLTISKPAPGIWYILLYGRTDYANITLSAKSYSVSDIILTEVPADNLTPPYVAKFKGRVVDKSGRGIPGLSLQARNPLTGYTTWLRAKTNAGGFWTFSAKIDREGAHTFDFFFSDFPDNAGGTATHTVYTRKASLDTEGLFDFSSYLPGLPSPLISAQTISMQTYLNIRQDWETGVVDASSEALWIEGTLGKAASDISVLNKLDEGLYLLFYSYDGTGCGNGLQPSSALRPCPLLIHVSPDKMHTVLNNLVTMGLLGETKKWEILAGKIGLVAFAALSNQDEEASGDCAVSLIAREQLEALANLAMNNSSVSLAEDRKFGNVMAKVLRVKVEGGTREFNVAAVCIPLEAQQGILKASYDKLVNSGLIAVEEGGLVKFFNSTGKFVAEIVGEQLIFKYPGFGGDMVMVEDKTTTVLGKFADVLNGYGTREVLSMPEGCFSRGADNPNGLNIMDLPSDIYDALLTKNIQKYLDEGKTLEEAKALSIIDGKEEFWVLYNYPFMEQACQRGDNIRVLSNKTYFKNSSDSEGGFFKREIKAIEDGWNGNPSLMQQYNYSYDEQASTYKRNQR
jgi:CubicO group peptidase (beta-lactamase class C family)/fibronectin type 3 domain-containing protein